MFRALPAVRRATLVVGAALLFALADAAPSALAAPADLDSLSFNPGSMSNPVVGGSAAVATVRLTAPAPAGGVRIEVLKLSRTSPIDLPTFGCFTPCTPSPGPRVVNVPEGATVRRFRIATFPTERLTQDQVGATNVRPLEDPPGATRSATLWVRPA